MKILTKMMTQGMEDIYNVNVKNQGKNVIDIDSSDEEN